MALTGSTNAEKAWNFLKAKGFNDYACAGIVGNLDCESALNSHNLQNTYEQILGFTDSAYVNAVDNGRYSREQFANDCAGFGLAQWTYHSRKRALYEFIKSHGVSIGDLEAQLEFFYKELSEGFVSAFRALQTTASVRDASNIMLLKYECPADMSASAQNRREAFSQKYYTQFATKSNIGGASNMGYINVSKKSGTKLSEHFNSNEFDCHGGGCCSTTIINEKLVEYLEKIREHFGKPITITSAYRCAVHNRNVNGATGSRHTKGDAADIVVLGTTPRTVAQYAESIGILGIGLYETSTDGHFVHIDTRDYKSFWYGQACAARTTFGAYSNTSSTGSSSGTSSTSDNFILANGSRGAKVKELQENLIALGYDLGNYGADGSFGNATAAAVKKFQKDHQLDSDGIAGYLTLTEIKKALQTQAANGYSVKVNASVLNIRKGAGTNYAVVGTIKDRGTYEIIDEATGAGAKKWGKLADGRGWIALDYCIKS